MAASSWNASIHALSPEWHHPRAELEALAERFRKLGFQADVQVVDGHACT